MSRTHEPQEQAHVPIAAADLVAFFERAEKPDPSTHVVGTELEKFGIVLAHENTPVALPYPVRFHDHIEPVLRGLVDQCGWAIGRSRGDDGAIIELERDNASITLEPGGQLELSGKPLHDIHQTCAEFTQHYQELDRVSRPLGVAWLTVGYHPFATREEIDWVPKGRYHIMREYLPSRGGHALDMMLRTCTVQANFDYCDENDCGDRFVLALAVAPLVTAVFANSPYEEGRATGRASTRADVWFDVDPSRCGVPPFAFDGGRFSYQRYVDWALDIPMFFVERHGVHYPWHGTFRQFLRDGWTSPDGTMHHATHHDWALHLSTLFPEVRLKPFVEVRSADAVTSRYVCALPALWKGMLYDRDARSMVRETIANLDRDQLMELSIEARRAGLRSPHVLESCRRLVEIARTTLDRFDVRDSKGRTEARFLDPIEVLLASGRCPADVGLEHLGPAPGRDRDARLAFVREFYFAGAEAREATTDPGI